MKRIEYIEPEEFQLLYKAEKDKEMRLVLLLGFGAGLRISEICGLKKKVSKCHKADLIEYKEVINNRSFKKYKCSNCNAELKFNDLRYAGEGWEIPPLTADKIDLVAHQIRIDKAKNDKWRIVTTPPLLTQDYLKFLPIKTPMRTIQYKFAELSMEVLKKKLSVHILRHGYANYLANVLNLPLPDVQRALGHSRLDTTGIYTKVNPQASNKRIWDAMTE